MRPINLLPSEALERQNIRRRRMLMALGMVAYLGLLAVATVWWQGKVDTAQQNIDAQIAVNDNVRREAAALVSARDLQSQYVGNVVVIESLLANDVAWGRLLNDFGRLIPETVWLGDFTGLSIPETAVAGVVGRVNVAGTGFEFTDVSAWLRAVSEDRFPGVVGTWVSTVTEGDLGGVPIVNFNSSITLTEEALSNRVDDRVPEVGS